MFSALTTAPVSRKSAICSATCRATFSCASIVEAPRCGVATTCGMPNSTQSLRRLLLEDVERGARHLPRLDRRLQVGLDHQRAAGAVDDAHAALHLRERRAR